MGKGIKHIPKDNVLLLSYFSDEFNSELIIDQEQSDRMD